MQTANDFSDIAALELDSIKAKLMHAKGGTGWSLERASSVEREYRRFLYLMKKFPNEPTAPGVDVDTFWHYHILDTMKYAADCQQVFGHFLHHFPYVGMRGKADEEALERMGERMRAIYEETFDEAYPQTARTGVQSARPALSAGIAAGAAYGAGARSVTVAPAYCTRAMTQAAYCTRAITEAAYCTMPAAEPAYCTQTSLSPSTIQDGKRPGAEAAGEAHARDGSGVERTHAQAMLPEQRTGFYLERPRLPQA